MGANCQRGYSGAICKSDLKTPKFEKLATVLSGLSAQADLDEAIQALQQLKSKKKGGEQALVRRTRTRRPVRKGAQSGAKLSPRAVLGRILRGRLTLNCGGQTKPRKQRKAKAPTLVESLKTSLAKASSAPKGYGDMAVLGPVIDSAAQVPVHSLRDRDQLTNFRPCDVVVKGVTGAVKVTEQADRELAGGDIGWCLDGHERFTAARG